MNGAARVPLLLLAACVAVPSVASAQLNDWLNARIDSAVAVAIGIRDGAKQPQPVAGTPSDASLIDRSAMPDVMGISLDLPSNLGSDSGAGSSVASFSGTPYMLLSLLRGRNPLDPNQYVNSRLARRLGVNVTFDTDDATGETVTLLQGKVLILDRGNPLQGVGPIRDALSQSTDAFGRIARFAQDTLWEAVGKQQYAPNERALFFDRLEQPAELERVLAAAGSGVVRRIDAEISAALRRFVQLRSAVQGAVKESRKRPELALGVTGRLAGDVPQEVRALLIFDWAPSPTFDVTFNAGGEHLSAIGTDPARTRLQVAGQLVWRMTPDNRLEGGGPVSLTVAGSGAFNFENSDDSIYRVQARLLLPIGEGVNVPVSFTWASRTDLIDEDRVQGKIGFTFDVAQLFAAAQ